MRLRRCQSGRLAQPNELVSSVSRYRTGPYGSGSCTTPMVTNGLTTVEQPPYDSCLLIPLV